jgi:glycosyltransferase involved in cell wall biosynthesis
MNICFILSSMHLSGGVRVIVEIANRLSDRGHEISIVFPGGTFDPDFRTEINPDISLIESKVERLASMNLLSQMRLTMSLAWSVPPSDVVISTHTPTTIAGWIAGALMHKGERVWYYQDYREMFLDRPFFDWLVRHSLRWNRGALVVSQSAKDELLSFVPGKQVILVGNGVSNLEYFHPIPDGERQNSKNGIQSILYLGDIRPRKGWFDFLAAVDIVYKQLPNIQLWIVSKEQCQIDTSVPYQFIYRPSRSELAQLYGRCDVFVSASWWESFGLPPLEAMACGAPVVMTDSRGVRDYGRDGENCLMVPIQNPQKLADAISRILTEPELANRLRKNAPPSIEGHNWIEVTDRFEQGLGKLLHDSGRKTR